MLPVFLKPYDVEINKLIRIGPNYDGGYIIHNETIKLTKKIITCGLNDDWKFEKKFKKLNTDCSVIAYDHTVNNDFWYKRFKKDIIHFFLLKKLSFIKIFKIFDYIDYKRFFKDKNKHFQKKIVKNPEKENEMSMTDVLKKVDDIILKVDIEGDEYEILSDITNNSQKIVSLIIEFHNLNKNLSKIEKFINENKFLSLIHIHANNFIDIDTNGNPNDIELTFVNNKKINVSNKKSEKSYPINGLDYKNFKRKNDIELKFND